MIFKRRLSSALLVLLFGAFASSDRSLDSKFDSDDLQVRSSRPSLINRRTTMKHRRDNKILEFYRSFIPIPRKLS